MGAAGTAGTAGTQGPQGVQGVQGTNGLNTLLRFTAEPVGTNCPFGGTRVEAGLDDNSNGTLEAGEVDATSYVCNPIGDPTTSYPGLAFRADRTVSGMVELFTVLPGGNGLKEISVPGLAYGEDVDDLLVSPDGTRIAFSVLIQGFRRLFVANLNTDNPAIDVSGTVVAGGDVETDFAWSPDSSRIAFRADRQTDNIIELYVVFADGTGLLKLSQALGANADVASFQWAPNGSRIAYTADAEATDNQTFLYSVLPTAGSRVNLSTPQVLNGNVLAYAWSADASRVAFIADRLTDTKEELFTNAAAGGNLVNNSGTMGALSDVFSFKWSPNRTGTQLLAFHSDRQVDTQNELCVVGAAVTTPTDVSLLPVGRDVTAYEWAPDASRLAFVADKDTATVSELHTVLPAGGASTKISGTVVTNGDVASYIFWAPDSSRIAFVGDVVTDAQSELFTALPTDGTGASRLTLNRAMPAGGDVLPSSPRWAPDSSRIAYHADEVVDDTFQFFAAPGATAASSLQLGTGFLNVLPATPNWSADSRQVSYVTQASELIVANPTVADTAVNVAGPLAGFLYQYAWCDSTP